MTADDLLWEMKPQTEGKHLVLRKYLDAWFPILGFTNGRILYIEAFAGPGEYTGGEDGSPVIALKAFEEHNARKKIDSEILFAFIDADADRIAHLAALVAPFEARLPKNVRIHIRAGDSTETLTELLDEVESQGKLLAPAFVMLDPFGVSDTPMSIIERILKFPRSEVFISLMYESINRFKGTPEFEPHLDLLFGTEEWRKAETIEDPTSRREYLFDLYADQLRGAGAKHVVRFELCDGNRLVYAIFFATKHELGCDRMKEAIWKADPMGGQRFRGQGAHDGILDLFGADFSELDRQLRLQFGVVGWVSVEAVCSWMQSDATIYHSGQMKKALKRLESGGLLEADPGSRKKKGTYPPGTRLKIAPP